MQMNSAMFNINSNQC